MSRLNIPTYDQSAEATKPLLASVQQQLGVVPNLMKLVGNSPAALAGFLSLNGALSKGKLDVKLRERIALAIAESNGCDYCLAAHTYLGKNVAKLSQQDIDFAREGHADDSRTKAALEFALRVSDSRGRVTDLDIATVRAAGFDDASVIEIIANVALNVLTNYINNVAVTDLDFPRADALQAA